MNPIDDFLKEASAESIPLAFGKTLATGAAAAAGAATIAGVGVAAQHIYNAATAKRDFKGMMQWNPDLAHGDARMVAQSFKTLRRFSPTMSKDPLVSGAMVRQMVMNPEGIAANVQGIVGVEKAVPKTVLPALAVGASQGVLHGLREHGPLGRTMPVARHEQEMQDAFYAHHDEVSAAEERASRAAAALDALRAQTGGHAP